MAKRPDPGEERFHRKLERDKAYQTQVPGKDEDSLPKPVEPVRADAKPERNQPCPCGSGKKYKQCCGKHRP